MLSAWYFLVPGRREIRVGISIPIPWIFIIVVAVAPQIFHIPTLTFDFIALSFEFSLLGNAFFLL